MNAPAYEPARLALMLHELRLPTIARLWPEFAQRSDKESWQATRFLATLLEHELAERGKRRVERHRAESHLDPSKTLATFDFATVPMLSKAHVTALASGDSWLEKGATVARQSLQLPAALAKLDRFDLLILDDISYVRKDQAETSVLFELIAERYERRSLLITANQSFSGWDQVFPDPGMTVAAIDRLVHHSTIFELNVESYRRKQAASDKQARRDSKKEQDQRSRQTAGTQ